MKNRISIYLCALGLLVSAIGCRKVSSAEDMDKIKKLESSLQDLEKKQDFNPWDSSYIKEAKKLRENYLAFAKNYKESPETPRYLFSAAEISLNQLKEPQIALELFQQIYKEFPEHESASASLFFCGYIYQNELSDTEHARQTYNEFLRKFPTHKFSLAAMQELKLMDLGSNLPFSEDSNSTQKADSVHRKPKNP